MKNNKKNAQQTAQNKQISRFLEIFKNGHNFIEAKNPYYDEGTKKARKGDKKKLKPEWRTEILYALRKKVLEERFFDPAELIGLSFGKKTRYCCLDIDKNSDCHPDRDENAYKKVLGILEDIGLVRPVPITSSWSWGFHVYYFFKEEIGTFNLACALEEVLKEHGIKIASGTLELFPNAKAYKANARESRYKAIRLPLQPMTGSYALDENYHAVSDDLGYFMTQAEWSMEGQDLELLKKSCKKYGNALRLKRCKRSGNKALLRFKQDLEKAIARGFTGKGQTNDLLLDIGCQGVVFEGLNNDKRELADYIYTTVKNLDGYEEYCGHQHNIEKRCLEVAKSSQDYYWTAGTEPKRERKTYQDNFGGVLENINNLNEARQINAQEKIEKTIAYVEEQIKEGLLQTLPKTASGFVDLVISTSKELFDTGIGKATLYRKNNQSLWRLACATVLTASQVVLTQPVEAEDIEPKQLEMPFEIVSSKELVSEVQEQREKEKKNNLFRELKRGLRKQAKREEKRGSKNAETLTNTGLFRPTEKKEKSKTLKPLQTLVCSDQPLYVGLYKNFPDTDRFEFSLPPTKTNNSKILNLSNYQNSFLKTFSFSECSECSSDRSLISSPYPPNIRATPPLSDKQNLSIFSSFVEELLGLNAKSHLTALRGALNQKTYQTTLEGVSVAYRANFDGSEGIPYRYSLPINFSISFLTDFSLVSDVGFNLPSKPT